MSPELFETIVIALLSVLTGAGGVHAYNKRKHGFVKVEDMLLTVGEHDKECSKRWEQRSKLCGLEIREAIREGFAEGAKELNEEIATVKKDVKKHDDQITAIRAAIKASYGGATKRIADHIEPG